MPNPRALAADQRPSRLMGSLRTALAIAVLQDVRPDLVIFDEFQKFRELLIDPPNVIARPGDTGSSRRNPR